MSELKCHHCTAVFYRRAAEVRRQLKNGSSTFYCTRTCNALGKALSTKVCENCLLQFKPSDGGAKFCSRSCAATINNSKYVKRKAACRNCKHCDKSYVENSRVGVFCSQRCNSDNYIFSWYLGLHSGSLDSGELTKRIKDYLKQQARYKSPNVVGVFQILCTENLS